MEVDSERDSEIESERDAEILVDCVIRAQWLYVNFVSPPPMIEVWLSYMDERVTD